MTNCKVFCRTMEMYVVCCTRTDADSKSRGEDGTYSSTVRSTRTRRDEAGHATLMQEDSEYDTLTREWLLA